MLDHFVYISSGGLIGLRARGDQLELSGRFEPIGGADDPLTAPRTQAFTSWLSRHKDDRFRIIVDTAEEEITLDELPPLIARDRREMTRKRLNSRYRDQRFKSCTPFALLGEKPSGLAALTGRRASSSVMMAIRGEAVLSPWLQIIERSQVNLHSLHTTALLAPTLLAREFKGKSGLLSSMQPGGLRQTLIVNGVLRFSRLAPVYQLADFGALVVELESTMQYMMMSQIANRDLLNGDFSIWLIGTGLPEADERPVQLIESADPRPVTLIDERVRPLRLNGEARQWPLGALPWWAASVRMRQAGYGYATQDQRVFASAAQLRKSLTLCSAGVAAACLIGAGGLEVFRLMRPDPASLLRKYEYLISEKEQELQASQADYGVTGTELNLLTQAADGLRHRHVDAVAMLAMVSKALDAELDLRLERLAWRRVGSESNRTATAAAGAGGSAAPVALAATAPPPGMAGAPAMATPAMGAVAPVNAEVIEGKSPTLARQVVSEVIVEIHGKAPKRIGKTESNRRAEDLLARLKRACACDAELVRWPFDNAPSSTISGDFLASKSVDQVPFEIRLKMSGPAVQALPVPSASSDGAGAAPTATTRPAG